MKKRFTVMLSENTIRKINIIRSWFSPIGLREEIERILDQYATDEIVARSGRYDK